MNCLRQALALFILSIFANNLIMAKAASRKGTYSVKTGKKTRQTYHKKTAYEGLGKQSPTTGKIKTKGIRGHGKRTKSGYTFVQPYAKSR